MTIQKKYFAVFSLMCMALFLSSCSGSVSDIREEFGLNKESPDEFRVVKRAPLEMPDSFVLPKPTPGASRPQEPTPRERAKAALTKQVTSSAQEKTFLSEGENLLLQEAGASHVDPNIRQIVDQEREPEKLSVIEKLGIKEPKAVTKQALDAEEEARKLQESGAVQKVIQPFSVKSPRKNTEQEQDDQTKDDEGSSGVFGE